MKIAIEPFLFDNALMNLCVYRLAAAWMGVRLKTAPTVLASLFGAVYALLSLFVVPALREPYWKLPCFLLFSLPLFKHAGAAYKALPYLLLSAALTGGTAMLLTLAFGGTVYADGTMVGTVPLRAALMSALAASCLPRVIRGVLTARRRGALHTQIVVQLKTERFALDALIDSGNLLREPITGLPVLLIERPVNGSLPIPFRKLSGCGVLYGERPVSVTLPCFANAAVDCVVAQAPEPIGAAQAVLPEILLPYDWRTSHDRMADSALGAPARAARHWQTRYLMVRSRRRRSAAAAGTRRGGARDRTCADRQGGEGCADRA